MKKLYNWFAGLGIVKRLMKVGIFAKLLSYEILSYLFFGVMTTAVNFLFYFLTDKITFAASGKELGEIAFFTFLKMDFTMETIANIIAWVAAVLFAFITNKLFVFESKNKKPGVVFKEFAGFVSGRILSLVLFEVLLFTLLCTIGLNDYIAKIAISVIVVIFNYIVSKLLVFRNKKDGGKDITAEGESK